MKKKNLFCIYFRHTNLHIRFTKLVSSKTSSVDRQLTFFSSILLIITEKFPLHSSQILECSLHACHTTASTSQNFLPTVAEHSAGVLSRECKHFVTSPQYTCYNKPDTPARNGYTAGIAARSLPVSSADQTIDLCATLHFERI